MKTIREDAEKYYSNNIFCDGITEFEHDIAIRCYIAGAKDQQERMYSVEDIENIWNEFVKELPPINNGASSDFLVYLKQFKKKGHEQNRTN